MAPMSDIPVGSPPAPPGRHAAPGGWYPDPLDGSRERYWDGWQWSRNTRESAVPPAYRQGPPGYQSGYQAVPQVAGPVPGVGRQQHSATADGVPLAGWWWRALAGLVDALLVGIVSGLLTLPFYTEIVRAFGVYFNDAMRAAQAGATTPPPQPNFAGMLTGTDQLLMILITFLIGMAYQLPLLRVRGATLGMAACGLRVVPVDEGRSQERLTWSVVLVRALLWVLPWSLSLWILTVADVLLPLWHPKRQTLHDLAARTQVVKLR